MLKWKVWRHGLIFKLERNGVSGTPFKLFKNYLSKRKRRVVLNGFSDCGDIKSGVPTKCVFDPLIFLFILMT